MRHDGYPAIVTLTPSHWPEVHTIYTAGIAGGHATFESAPPTWERFDATRPRWVPDSRCSLSTHASSVRAPPVSVSAETTRRQGVSMFLGAYRFDGDPAALLVGETSGA